MRRIMSHYQGAAADFAYESYARWNASVFGGRLRAPLVVWGLVPYGHGYGWVRDSAPPVLFLHPAILHPAEDNPWRLPGWMPGRTFAADVILHQMCMLDAAASGDWRADPERRSWWKPHQNPRFVDAANRAAAKLGYGRRVEYAVKGIRRRGGKPAFGFMTEPSGGRVQLSAEGFPWNLPGRKETYRKEAEKGKRVPVR